MIDLAWKRSATGNWVAFDGRNRYSIESLACYEGKRQVRRYRLRINGSAVGGAHPRLFPSVAAAKKWVQDGLEAVLRKEGK